MKIDFRKLNKELRDEGFEVLGKAFGGDAAGYDYELRGKDYIITIQVERFGKAYWWIERGDRNIRNWGRWHLVSDFLKKMRFYLEDDTPLLEAEILAIEDMDLGNTDDLRGRR